MAINTKVVTGKIRGSYVNIFHSRVNDLSGKDEYSMCVLIDKNDKETVGKVKKVIDDLMKDKWGNKPPVNAKNPLRDGDKEKPDDDTYKGKYFMNLKSSMPPRVVDRALNEVIDERECVSGDYFKVSMSGYVFDMKGNCGVAFGLNNVQFVEKGEPLTGRSRAEDDFNVLEDEPAW